MVDHSETGRSHERRTLLLRGGGQVTSTRFQTETTMYPINGITAVSLVDMPKNHAPGLAVLFIGLIILWFGMSSLNSGSTTLIVGLLTFLGGAVLIFMTKKKWAVSIGTAGGQQHAVVSTDRAYVQRIVQALNEAVTRRG